MRLAFLTAAALVMTTSLASATDDMVEKGEKVFRKCKACHTAEEGGANKTGPNLFAIYGKEAGTNDGYKYSKAFMEKAAEGLVWTDENLETWLSNPQGFIKKSKMVLKLNKASERESVIAYLKSLK